MKTTGLPRLLVGLLPSVECPPQESGFAEIGGRFEAWLIHEVTAGRLDPAEVERRAHAVVGDAAVDRWRPSER